MNEQTTAKTEYLARADGLQLAYAKTDGQGPTIVFLPGYMSDMEGGKALALWDWAVHHKQAMLRLDYSGCGASEGQFTDGTLEVWRDDVLHLLDHLTTGPLVLVGSSMGGWLMLLAALARPDRIAGLVGIAPAPDFTDWGFSETERASLRREGRIVEPSDYSDTPYVTTCAFWESGQRNLLLKAGIPISCPVRILHGQRDDSVPWETALRLMEALESTDVAVHLFKDGDHRLSRDQDIAVLITTVSNMLL